MAQEEANAQKVARASADRVKGARNVIQPFSGPRLRQQQQFMREANHWFAFEAARNIAQSRGKGAKAKTAMDILKAQGPKAVEAGRAMIRDRAKRAAAAAARGSKPAARATEIYDRQLAPVLPKGKGKGKNVIKPGPRNTQGQQKPKRKRKPKPKG